MNLVGSLVMNLVVSLVINLVVLGVNQFLSNPTMVLFVLVFGFGWLLFLF